jgi:transposase
VTAGSSEGYRWSATRLEVWVTHAWVGIDVGKEHHWAVALDADGQVLLSRRVSNDEAAIVELVDQVSARATHLRWAIDLTNGYAAMLLAVLWERDQPVVYLPGKAVNRAADGYRSEGKTDQKDALIIADQARLRRDFAQVRPPAELLTTLSLLVGYRRDLIADKQRMITRLRELLSSVFPSLERTFEFNRKGPLVLVARWQTPDAVRRAGRARIAAHLRRHSIPRAEDVAAAAVAAAATQTRALPGEQLVARLVGRLAEKLLDLREEVKSLDAELQQQFAQHPQAAVITSLPGMGTLLSAEFVVALGELANFSGPDHLAAYAGLAPVPRDSGRRTGNLHRPQRYNRTLQRVFYTSAMAVIGQPGPSRDYYLRKRSQGQRHIQAVIALSRRRVNVLWAMMRDDKHYAPGQARPALEAA